MSSQGLPKICLSERALSLEELQSVVFLREDAFPEVEVDTALREKIARSRQALEDRLKSGLVIYGVNTGFGDSCHRVIPYEKAQSLQQNLAEYLNCGSGKILPREVSRAVLWIHLRALSRGFSGVSLELLDQMKFCIENDCLPEIPEEGSLGASGDLVPLSYLARMLSGRGPAIQRGERYNESQQIKDFKSYVFKPKEALSTVNGTTVMSAYALYNWRLSEFSLEMATLTASWQCLALGGRREAFGPLVNREAKRHGSQSLIAERISQYLDAEDYRPLSGSRVPVKNDMTTEGYVQDRYSLRCVPQILGPQRDTLDLISRWIEDEVNSCTDNPLLDPEGEVQNGGNFYGGYLAHGMDYLKISLANLADLLDRQILVLVDDKSNRGLPPNLVDWERLPPDEKHLHHGLKGLHQAASAITAEIIQKSFPSSVLSRSTESHNQDKVSMGMGAAAQASEMLEKLFTLQSLQLVCLAQALDLRKIALKGEVSKKIFAEIRRAVPFVDRDQSLGPSIGALRSTLWTSALNFGPDYFKNR